MPSNGDEVSCLCRCRQSARASRRWRNRLFHKQVLAILQRRQAKREMHLRAAKDVNGIDISSLQRRIRIAALFQKSKFAPRRRSARYCRGITNMFDRRIQLEETR